MSSVDKPVGRGGGKRLIQALGDNFRGKENQGSGAARCLKVIPRAALVTGHWGGKVFFCGEVAHPGDRQGTEREARIAPLDPTEKFRQENGLFLSENDRLWVNSLPGSKKGFKRVLGGMQREEKRG